MPDVDSSQSSSTSLGEVDEHPFDDLAKGLVWEVCCGLNSRLSNAADAAGFDARRFTLPEFDLSTERAGQRCRQLCKQHRPQHVWISIPCTAVSHMQQMAKKTKTWHERLVLKLKETRAIQRQVLRIMRQTARQGGCLCCQLRSFLPSH